MKRTQIDSSGIEKTSTTKNFSMPTLMEETKAMVLLKDDYEYLEEKIGFFPLKFPDYQVSEAKQKNKKFLI